MSMRKAVKISTTNTQPAMRPHFNNEKGTGLDIEVTCEGTVSTTLEEASEWYQGEDKLIASIQADQLRRQANAARPLLRDAEQPDDWQAIAQAAIDSYTPGQRGGRATPTVDQTELAEASAGGMDSILAYLRGRGIQVAPQGGEETEGGTQDETSLSDEDLIPDDELSEAELEAATAPQG